VGGVIALIVLVLIATLWVWPSMRANAIGRGKGQENAWLWGLALSWIGVLIVSSAPNRQTISINPEPYARPPTKLCPACAELVKSQANVCRFCGHEFDSP
jgi:zinc-ribbon domain